MSLPDHCCFAAERQGGGSGGGFWRPGFADGFRAARVGDAVVEGDDDFGNFVYADVDFALDHRDAQRRIVDGSDTGASRRKDDHDRPGNASAGAAEEVVSITRPSIAEVAELADALA